MMTVGKAIGRRENSGRTMASRQDPGRGRMGIAVLLLSILALMGCAGNVQDQDSLSNASMEERNQVFSQAQASLLDQGSKERAQDLFQYVERPRTVSGNFVREAIDLSSSGIDYYSVDQMAALVKVGGAGETITQTDQALELVDYGPEGLLPIENRQPRIYVMFNQPMVALAKLGEPIIESDLLTISPQVSGTYRWYGTRAFSFEPDVPLLEHPSYTVSIPAGITSLAGGQLAEAKSFQIFTERLELVNYYPGSAREPHHENYNVPPDKASRMVMEFNQSVDATSLLPSISVSVGRVPVSFSLEAPEYPAHLASRQGRAIQLVLHQVPEPGKTVEVTIAKGAEPRPGYPPSQEDFQARFYTLDSFIMRDIGSWGGDFPRDNSDYVFPVYITFSHPLEEGAAGRAWEFMLDGQPEDPASIESYGSTLRVSFANIRPGQTLRFKNPAELRDIYSRPLENSILVWEYQIPRPDALMEMPGRSYGSMVQVLHLEQQFDPLIAYQHRNLTSIDLGSVPFDPLLPVNRQFSSIELQPLDLSAAIADYVRFDTIDLSPHLNSEGFGSAFYRWRAVQDSSVLRYGSPNIADEFIVYRTDIGMTLRMGYNRALVWVNSLSTGQALEGAEVKIMAKGSGNTAPRLIAQGYTDAQGLARIDFSPALSIEPGQTEVHVSKDSDYAVLPFSGTQNHWRFGVYSYRSARSIQEQRHVIQMFTDRGLYKAGEELALRGIDWIIDHNGYSSRPLDYRISISTWRTRNQPFWTTGGTTSASGGFSQRLRLPANLDSGEYTITYESGGFRAYEYFYVTDFRRAAFQVKASIPEENVILGDSVGARVEASYLSGGSLPSADYDYFWTRRPVTYRPPGTQWENWNFGTNQYAADKIVDRGSAVLDANGSARISVATDGAEIASKPYSYAFEVRVQDIDRQEISSSAEVLVHPLDEYIAARFINQGVSGWWSRFISTKSESLARVQLVGIDGEALAREGDIEWVLVNRVWKSVQMEGLYGRLGSSWELVEEEVDNGRLRLVNGTADLGIRPEEAGNYILRFRRNGPGGRSTETDISFYATGGGWVQTASQTPSDIELIVDKAEYMPGEKARILVQSPVPGGKYLLSIERAGILEERIIELESGTQVIEVDVREEYLPVFYLALSSFTKREAVETDYFKPDLGKPRGLFGITEIRVSTKPVELDVAIEEASGAYGPGEEIELKVRVSREGKPVSGAEVTLLAVDRGVLDLINYRIPNPLAYFYRPDHFPLGVSGDDSRRLLLRPVTYDIATLQGGDGLKMEERSDYNPLALFEPEILTDQDGWARARFTLPDSLTTYRVTAVAMSGTRLGHDESEFMVQNPINMRSALPRQFRPRDTAAAGVILTNLSPEAVDVELSLESDILHTPENATKRLRLEANSVTEVPFVLQALEAGLGSISFTLKSSLLNERLTEEVRVAQPLVIEAFSTVGSIDGRESTATEGLILPSAISPGYGSLDLKLASSMLPLVLPSIEEILIPVSEFHQPYYGEIERLLDLNVRLLAYGTGGYQHNNILERLSAKQFTSGGIGYREPGEFLAEPNLLLSIIVAHTIQTAKEQSLRVDHDIDVPMLISYLQHQLDAILREGKGGMSAAWTALILQKQGLYLAPQLDRVLELGDQLGLAGYNLLSEAFFNLGFTDRAMEIHRQSRNFVNIGTQSIDIRQTAETASYFASTETEAALLLRAATLLDVDSDYLIRLAGTLSRTQNHRRFRSDFDNYWMLRGFEPLLAREAADPDGLRAGISIAGEEILSLALRDRSEEAQLDSFSFKEEPLASLERDQLHELEIRKEGEGPLYYTNILRYSLPVETSLPRDEGIEVISQIETLDGQIIEGDILPLGETLRMRIFVSTSRRQSFLNLRIPLPSGAEVLDPNLAVTGSYVDAGGLESEEWTRETVYGDTATFTGEGYMSLWYWDYWFYRPITRYYASSLSYTWEDFYAGSREISFLFRTTTPGIYPTPPIQASLEFEPEVFGRSGGRLFVIRSENED